MLLRRKQKIENDTAVLNYQVIITASEIQNSTLPDVLKEELLKVFNNNEDIPETESEISMGELFNTVLAVFGYEINDEEVFTA